MSCIFCKIVAGELPCHKVHEDERTLAFLDVGPVAPGHTLVIPKAHHERLEQMPADLAGHCASVVNQLAPRVLRATGANAWNLLQNNGELAHQAVGHVHFHIIPRRHGDRFAFTWIADKLDPQEARKLVEAIQQ